MNIVNMNRPLLRAYRATLSYDGSGFKGSQLQKDVRTVVGEVSKALSKVLGHPSRPKMASRTDSGVHATGQVMGFRTSSARTADEIRKGLNSLLPHDIRITDCSEVGFDFHPRHSALGKMYSYRIFRARELSPMLRTQVFFVPEEKPFNYDLFESVAKEFEGTHDFRSFSPRLMEGENPVKQIFKVQVGKQGQLLEIKFTGSGFLYQMVRRMVGLLIAVAQGREKPSAVKMALNNPHQGIVIYNAQPQGLVLEKIFYEDYEIQKVIEGSAGS